MLERSDNFYIGPPVDPSTYESLALMTALTPSNVVITYATTDVESGDDEEIFDEEMTHSYKITYEKLVETIKENRGLLEHISQLCREKNDLFKQDNVLKIENEESLNELEHIKKTMRMMNLMPPQMLSKQA